MSILSWDSLEEEVASVGKPDLVKAAADNLAKLDTSGFEKQMQAEQVAREQLAANRQPPVTNTSGAMAKAQASVEQLKKENFTGERVSIKDKFLMNCDTDLNQLVPFKYPWAWSLYLTSCDRHWGIGELELYKALEYLEDVTSEQLGALRQLETDHRLITGLYSDQDLLTNYRLITNPECRQYLLRNVAEKSAWHHLMVEVDEVFGELLETKGTQAVPINKAIYAMLAEHTQIYLRDPKASTKGQANLDKFLTSFITNYFITSTLLRLPGWFKTFKLSKQDASNSLTMMLDRTMRDLAAQLTFAQIFVDTGVGEGTFELNDHVRETLNVLGKNTTHLICRDQAINEQEDYFNLCNLFLNYGLHKLTGGSTSADNKMSEEVSDFFNLFLSKVPTVDFNATLSGADLGW